jgi:hypothetical protein
MTAKRWSIPLTKRELLNRPVSIGLLVMLLVPLLGLLGLRQLQREHGSETFEHPRSLESRSPEPAPNPSSVRQTESQNACAPAQPASREIRKCKGGRCARTRRAAGLAKRLRPAPRHPNVHCCPRRSGRPSRSVDGLETARFGESGRLAREACATDGSDEVACDRKPAE